MTNDVVEAKLRQLAERFLTTLPGDLARLRSAMADDEPAAVVGGILHRMAGRAGTFGFPRISDQASRLEALVLEGRWTEDERAGAAFEAGLDALEALSAEALEAGR
jgi:HPt (histidine-containing phosphotransfer) domain-containing protein